MDKKEITSLLIQKAIQTGQRKHRIAIFLFVIPILYYLLRNSFIKNIDLLVKFQNLEILIFLTPLIYSLLIFYFIFLNEDYNAVKESISKSKNNETPIGSYFYSWRHQVFPQSIILEFTRNMKHKDFLGEVGTIFIFFPVLISLILGPIFFIIYTIYYNFTISGEPYFPLNYISAVLALWILAATALYIRNMKIERRLMGSY